MSATFAVYAAPSIFTKELVAAFEKIGATELFSALPSIVEKFAPNAVILLPFHNHETIRATRQLRIILYTHPTEIVQQKNVYYVARSANPHEVARELVKKYAGFRANEIYVFTPHITDVPSFAEGVFIHEHVVATSSPSVPTPVPTHTLTPPSIPITSVKKEVLQPEPVVKAVVQPTAPALLKKRKKITLPSLKKLPRKESFFKGVFLLLFLLVGLPYMLLAVSGLCGFVGVKTAAGNTAIGSLFLRCSKSVSAASLIAGSVAGSTPLSPLVGWQRSLASFVNDGSALGLEALSIYKDVRGNLTPDRVIALSPQLSRLSRDAALFSSKLGTILPKDVLDPAYAALFSRNELMHVVASAASRADYLLGQSRPMTYVVLLQNNMELRPTGGFIGSFLLIEVHQGQITQQKIYDVYDADGQLAGYIKPPAPIADYLGEASWFLRDSNWDPDFSISAQRAVWFLDKSINRQVDGVVGVNLEVLRGLLKSVGPIVVPDYGGELTYDNFYETIQSEVHKEFFPGSKKKSNYLTAVFNSVITKLQQQKTEKMPDLLLTLLQNIDGRDIQLFMQDSALQADLARAHLTGEIAPSTAGFVEANLGVNKANQFVQRQGAVRVRREGERVLLSQELEIKNHANTQSDETRYRMYTRAFAPKGSTLVSLSVLNKEKLAVVPAVETVGNREEVGVFVEVKAGESARFILEWSVPSAQTLTLWKQGGVAGYPLSIETLTENGQKRYNTTFDKDINLSL